MTDITWGNILDGSTRTPHTSSRIAGKDDDRADIHATD
jgi:hypothetical protein